MAKVKPTEGKSKTDIVRDYIRSNPTAPASQIVADLKPYGISDALAKKTKYPEGRKRRGAGGKRGPATTSRKATESDAGSKADAIREAAKTLPKPVRPRDVMAVLAERGMTVSNSQVGQVLKGMGMRRRRGRRKAATASGATAGSAVATATASGLTIESLIAAKKLADQLDGAAVAKQAVDALARLG